MLSRLSKKRGEEGFTLIELLVVMIIIGILAAIGIPLFLNQREKARSTATQADVSTMGKELATWYVDGPPATLAVADVDVTDPANPQLTVFGADVGRASDGTEFEAVSGAGANWCVALSNAEITNGDNVWQYSAAGGLEGPLAAETCP